MNIIINKCKLKYFGKTKAETSVDLPERHESYNGRAAIGFPTARAKTRLNSLIVLTLFF